MSGGVSVCWSACLPVGWLACVRVHSAPAGTRTPTPRPARPRSCASPFWVLNYALGYAAAKGV